MHLASGNNKPLQSFGVSGICGMHAKSSGSLQRLECNPCMHRSMKR